VELGREPAERLVIDRFRLRSRRTRAGAAPATGELPGTIVVAYPQTCGTAAVSPTALVLVGPQGQAAEATAFLTERKAVQALVPGMELPTGSVAATFAIDVLQNRISLRVRYPPQACAGEAAERTPVLAYSGAQLLESPMPARPADDTSGAAWVAVQAVIDHQGRFQQARALGGPPRLVQAALAAVATWQAQPVRANGEPVAAPVVLRVLFEPVR
jgi:hypothetical protein